MPFLFDHDGRKVEVSRGTFYLTGLVESLFEDMRDVLVGRVRESDLRDNWFQLVGFVLFVIRVVHAGARKDIHGEIESYIHDEGNPDSYLRLFNNPEYQELRQYEVPWLAGAVTRAYQSYWEAYTRQNGGTDSARAANELLRTMLTRDQDELSNVHDMFSFLGGKFANGEYRLFEG